MIAGPNGVLSRVARGIASGVREAAGLVVDDALVAFGVILAVAVTATLAATRLGSDDALGWVLFALVWVALAVSLRRARHR